MSDTTTRLRVEILGVDGYSKEFANISRVTKEHEASLRQIGMVAKTSMAVVAGGVGAAIKANVTFQGQLTKVGTMLDTTTKQYLPQYAGGLKKFAGQFGQSTKTLSDGLYDILSAQISAKDAMKVLESNSRAAAAGFTDVGSATSASLSFLKAYGMEASEVDKVNNALFATVKMGRMDFSQLATSVGDVVGSAGALKIPIYELGAALSVMTKSGISTNQATTSLNQIMMQFIKGSETMKLAVDDLGYASSAAMIKQEGLAGSLGLLKGWAEKLPDDIVKVKEAYADLEGQGVKSSDILGILSTQFGMNTEKIKALTKLTPDTTSVLGELFGSVEALKGVLPITGEKAEEFVTDLKFIKTSMEEGKLVTDTYKEVQKDLGFRFTQLKEKALNVGRSLGEKFTPEVESALNMVQDLLDKINASDEAFNRAKTTIEVFAGIVGTGLLIGAIIKAELALLSMVQAVVSVGLAVGTTGSAMALVGTHLAALTIVIWDVYYAWKNWDSISNTLDHMSLRVKALFDDMLLNSALFVKAIKAVWSDETMADVVSWYKKQEQAQAENYKFAHDQLYKEANDRVNAAREGTEGAKTAYDKYLKTIDKNAIEHTKRLEKEFQKHTAAAVLAAEKQKLAAIKLTELEGKKAEETTEKAIKERERQVAAAEDSAKKQLQANKDMLEKMPADLQAYIDEGIAEFDRWTIMWENQGKTVSDVLDEAYASGEKSSDDFRKKSTKDFKNIKDGWDLNVGGIILDDITSWQGAVDSFTDYFNNAWANIKSNLLQNTVSSLLGLGGGGGFDISSLFSGGGGGGGTGGGFDIGSLLGLGGGGGTGVGNPGGIIVDNWGGGGGGAGGAGGAGGIGAAGGLLSSIKDAITGLFSGGGGGAAAATTIGGTATGSVGAGVGASGSVSGSVGGVAGASTGALLGAGAIAAFLGVDDFVGGALFGNKKQHAAIAPTMDPNEALEKLQDLVKGTHTYVRTWDGSRWSNDLQKTNLWDIMAGDSLTKLGHGLSAGGMTAQGWNATNLGTAISDHGAMATGLASNKMLDAKYNTLGQLVQFQDRPLLDVAKARDLMVKGFGTFAWESGHGGIFHGGGIAQNEVYLPKLLKNEGVVSPRGMETLFGMLNQGSSFSKPSIVYQFEALLKVNGDAVIDRQGFENFVRDVQEVMDRISERAA